MINNLTLSHIALDKLLHFAQKPTLIFPNLNLEHLLQRPHSLSHKNAEHIHIPSQPIFYLVDFIFFAFDYFLVF